HFRKAQELRPRGVTNFYREGMLFKQIERKTEKSIPLFERAAGNWENMEESEKKERMRERKNYVKSLYQLASALLETNRPTRALGVLEKCIEEDEDTNYISPLYKYFGLGKIHFQLNSYKKAKDALEFAASCEAERPIDFVYELLARTHLAMGDEQGAAAAVNRVPEKSRRPYYRWTEADVLCALKDFRGARIVLLRSIERDKRSAHKALIRLARIEYLSGDFRKTGKYAKAAQKFFQDTWGGLLDEASFWEALSAYHLGEHEHAVKIATELKGRNPRYPKLDRLLASLAGRTPGPRGGGR
ncbi:MAG: tetratricopeptide repeat protein, partial [Deltaproteobacteria bacterium]|nr:tetratricopeptide repeat protein [Deltaproteobacteria bacterium]